jgi:3-dehydroquinate synthase
MIPISIDVPSFVTELYIGRQLLQGDLLGDLCKRYGSQIAIITDPHVNMLYGQFLAEKLGARVFEVPRGEKAKTREVKRRIEDELLASGYGRDTVILGLGGGSVTDLAGFIASTYLRGVALILIPTSLLAMVDASIGGKTAVDTPLGKNLIGSFYPPKAIVSDLDTLQTLPEKEKQNGLSEIIKMGLIFDSDILIQLASVDALEPLVRKACQAKIAVTTQDPWDRGLRRILNFGHTIGHALEAASRFEISHGEAVAIGCIAESYLSKKLGYLSQDQFLQIKDIYSTHLNPLVLPKDYNSQSLLRAILLDKKKSVQGVRCVLLDQIGCCLPFEGQYCKVIQEQDVKEAFSYLEAHYA